MNMRYKGYIWWAWLLLVLFSCTENEQTAELVKPGEVRMSMNISTRTTNDPEVLNANENRISRLRIYVFDGTSLDKMYYWQGLIATDGTYTTPVFTVKAATGKTLYAIVNEPVDTNTRAILESVDHPNDLEDVEYLMADYMTRKTNVVEYAKEYCLPMYGELGGVDAAEGTTHTVNMSVDRAVARVDVYMRKESGNQEEVSIPSLVVVTGVALTGFISPEKIGNNTSSAIYMLSRKTGGEVPEETSLEDKGILAYSFYVPEMGCKGRKMEIGIDEYDMIKLGGDTNNSGGTPLEKLERNHVYQLLCRFLAKTSTLDTDLTVCPWIALESQVEEIKADIHITNCFIVPPGGRVHIPTDGVYKAWAQMDEFERMPIPDGEITVEVLWQDEMGVMTEHSVKVMNADKRDKAYIVVETGNQSGNAVIAMKVNGEIFWSWHIWCTDYNPNLKEGQQEFFGYTWMDRNIGMAYNTSTYHKEGGLKSKGLLYQWGRKDPFPPVKGWAYTEPDEDLYNITGDVKIVNKVRVSEHNNIPNSVHQPLTFFTPGGSTNIWYAYYRYVPDAEAAINHYLWNNQLGKKTVFDPCPAGWRVPADVVWDKSSYRRFEGWRGFGFSLNDKRIYFPCAGICDSKTGEFDGFFQYSGGCWQATSAVELNSPSVACVICGWTEYEGGGTGLSSAGAGASWEHSAGLSVRCVRE